MISWKATAIGIVSDIPIVNGDGPRDEPIPTILAVRNSRLPTLSAREIDIGLMRPLTAASLRLDGGRGIAMLLLLVADVGVGICRPLFLFISATSEKISPKSA